jgi:glycosyltransferase involved in cell wall biosynthesis
MEQVVVALATELKARGHRPHVVCTYRRGPLADNVVAKGVPVHECFFASALDNLGSKRLSRVLKDINADVVHSHTGVWLGAVTAARRAGIAATCHTEHGLTGHEGWKLQLQQMVAARLTAALVAVSDQLQAVIAERAIISRSRVLRIDNGVSVPQHARDDGVRAEVRAELDLLEDDVLIGTAGRLQHLKGFDVLIEALDHAEFKNRVTVVLAGDGEDRQSLESAARNSPVPIQFLGERRDVERLMRAYDVFVLPSRSEGLPMALLEAMAAGLGIVATAVGEVPKAIENEAGIVVPALDPKALAAALSRMVDDVNLRNHCGSIARARVEAIYSRSGMVDAYESLYERLMRRSNLKTSGQVN